MYSKCATTQFARTLVGALTVAACVATSHPADGANAPQAPLMIQQQGSFAVGGTVIRSPGTYIRIAQVGKAKPCMATMLASSIKSPRMPASCRS